MRVVTWQRTSKPNGGDCRFAGLHPVTGIATMTAASHAAGRSFGLHHNYIERPWGPGGASPG